MIRVSRVGRTGQSRVVTPEFLRNIDPDGIPRTGVLVRDEHECRHGRSVDGGRGGGVTETWGPGRDDHRESTL